MQTRNLISSALFTGRCSRSRLSCERAASRFQDARGPGKSSRFMLFPGFTCVKSRFRETKANGARGPAWRDRPASRQRARRRGRRRCQAQRRPRRPCARAAGLAADLRGRSCALRPWLRTSSREARQRRSGSRAASRRSRRRRRAERGSGTEGQGGRRWTRSAMSSASICGSRRRGPRARRRAVGLRLDGAGLACFAG